MSPEGWNHELLESVLSPYDVEAVRRIPVSTEGGVDRLVWHFEDNGLYTVRSGYRLARSEAIGGPSCSNGEEARWWTKLWSSSIPPKIKHLVWRVWFEAIPTMGNLRKREIKCLPFCDFCGELPESAVHAVWGCDRAQGIWRASVLERWVGKTGTCSFKEICFRAASSLTKEHFELFCGLVWAAWSDRNARTFEHATKTPETWVCEVAGWVENFKTHSLAVEGADKGSGAVVKSWSRPGRGRLKLNVDAAWSAGEELTSIGCVVRDHNGDVVGVLARGIRWVDSALSAECFAIREGLRFAKERGWSISAVESDCLRASQLVNGKHTLGHQGAIIEDILSELEIVSIHGGLVWVPRECNEAAHTVAKYRQESLSFDVELLSCPLWLFSCITKDCESSFLAVMGAGRALAGC